MAAEDQRDTPEAFIRGVEAGVEKKFTAQMEELDPAEVRLVQQF